MSIIDWIKARSEHKPFSALDAYTLSSVNKTTSLEEVYQNYLTEVLGNLKRACSGGRGYIEKYILFENYITQQHKERIEKDLTELGYRVLYKSDISMVVSWAHLKTAK